MELIERTGLGRDASESYEVSTLKQAIFVRLVPEKEGSRGIGVTDKLQIMA